MVREISLVLIAIVYLLLPDGLSCRLQSCEWLAGPMQRGNIFILFYFLVDVRISYITILSGLVEQFP